MDILTLVLFVAILLGCVICDISIIYALAAGYVLFAAYTLIKGFSLKALLSMSWQGLKTVSTILFTFMLIGILTALWRAGGTIATIVCSCAGLIHPAIFVLLTFLLCCLVSVLTGTAFGTSATMGAICVTIAHAMGLSPVMIGGAVLAGAYFGDRCSPVSTSALLTATVTKTDLYKNIKNMIRSSVVPFVLSCLLYGLCGLFSAGGGGTLPDIRAVFSMEFRMGFIAVIPALVIVLLALVKANVKLSMLCSIAASVLVCLFYQKLSVTEILRYALLGFTPQEEALRNMISGGGILSMLNVTAIVCISSLYSGIFSRTGLLAPVTRLIGVLAKRVSAFAVTLIVSLVTGAVACNQTLSIMLTQQLCDHLEQDKERFALYLENSAVVIVPLLPWTVACSVSLTSAGAPIQSFPLAFFLYLLPVCSLIGFRKNKE
ncbi:MAG: sodium:proton antiporter [Oscillospiraceae bacterium]|nr:sodium:proton antiporter [Oscillospiraceae bacterium]